MAPTSTVCATIVAQELAAFLAARSLKSVTPTVVALRTMATGVVEAELSRLGARLPELDDVSRAEVEKAIHRVAVLSSANCQADAGGAGSVAIGFGASAASTSTIALGLNATATQLDADCCRAKCKMPAGFEGNCDRIGQQQSQPPAAREFRRNLVGSRGDPGQRDGHRS